MSAERGRRKTTEGVVISNKMDKTVTVKVTRKMRHEKYGKVIERSKKYYAHDESDAIEVGQKVRIMETRPFFEIEEMARS